MSDRSQEEIEKFTEELKQSISENFTGKTDPLVNCPATREQYLQETLEKIKLTTIEELTEEVISTHTKVDVDIDPNDCRINIDIEIHPPLTKYVFGLSK